MDDPTFNSLPAISRRINALNKVSTGAQPDTISLLGVQLPRPQRSTAFPRIIRGLEQDDVIPCPGNRTRDFFGSHFTSPTCGCTCRRTGVHAEPATCRRGETVLYRADYQPSSNEGATRVAGHCPLGPPRRRTLIAVSCARGRHASVARCRVESARSRRFRTITDEVHSSPITQ